MNYGNFRSIFHKIAASAQVIAKVIVFIDSCLPDDL